MALKDYISNTALKSLEGESSFEALKEDLNSIDTMPVVAFEDCTDLPKKKRSECPYIYSGFFSIEK